ncbi:MAG: type II toxin-antitoxin system HicA family toxin [Ignavibacteria bacterium]|nr:type II toxin-antitoxin system HicA family toxin [Ignavibacteria bacterium]
MKRGDILRYLAAHGCLFLREGGKHTVYYNPENSKTSTIPRHNEIKDILAKKICKDLGIPPIR